MGSLFLKFVGFINLGHGYVNSGSDIFNAAIRTTEISEDFNEASFLFVVIYLR